LTKACVALLTGWLWMTAAEAAPNWLWQTGLFIIPTANALNAREWNVTFHHTSDVHNVAAVSAGLTRGLEVGAIWYDPEGGGQSEEVTGHVKYQILHDRPHGFGLAVGWWDVADTVNDTRHRFESAVFAVASRRVAQVEGRVLRAHFGVGSGSYDGVFAGADLRLSPRLQALAEYDGRDVNAGIRWQFGQRSQLDLGLVSENFGVGASYGAAF
jgi:hypothetical protein